ncbi:MAG: hypothetical protein P4L91_13200 [Burkholderiaceae bacterium]|nr:hypothetical protein [Burkholderiaceae bacterium]
MSMRADRRPNKAQKIKSGAPHNSVSRLPIAAVLAVIVIAIMVAIMLLAAIPFVPILTPISAITSPDAPRQQDCSYSE